MKMAIFMKPPKWDYEYSVLWSEFIFLCEVYLPFILKQILQVNKQTTELLMTERAVERLIAKSTACSSAITEKPIDG